MDLFGLRAGWWRGDFVGRANRGPEAIGEVESNAERKRNRIGGRKRSERWRAMRRGNGIGEGSSRRPINRHLCVSFSFRCRLLHRLISSFRRMAVTPESSQPMAAAPKPTVRNAQSQELVQEDRLGKLPDDILLRILERLQLPDAVRTCVLSRRWRHLPGLRSDITLDVKDYQPDEDVDGVVFTLDDLVRSNVMVVEATKGILAHKSHYTINLLSIRFYLGDEAIDIARSIDRAMENREVVAVAFTILSEVIGEYITDNDMLATGRRFVSFFDACPRGFGSLRELRIESVRFGDSDIPNVLSACKKLEQLRMENCDSGFESTLKVEHSQLTKLEIVYCAFQWVELSWLPKLTHLKFQDWMHTGKEYPLSLGHVPNLRKLYLNNLSTTLHKTFRLSEFLGGNAMTRIMCLDFQCHRIWVQPEGPKRLAPLLQNLRIVFLYRIYEGCDLTWTMFLLQAAPQLKQMYIQMLHTCDSDEHGENEELWQQIYHEESGNDRLTWQTPDGFKHYKLDKLRIMGFQPEEKLIGYIRRVVEAALNLDNIWLLDTGPCSGCQFGPSARFPRTDEEKDLIRKQIFKEGSSPVKIRIGI